jgi:ABC-type multidrug transport system fused ATPase/permease subunit
MIETKQSTLRVIRMYPRVFALIWETNPLSFIQVVLLTLCSAVVFPVQIWITKLIIDRIVEMVHGVTPALPIDWYTALMPVGALVLVSVVGMVCQTLSGRAKSLLSIQVRHHTEYLILQKATQLDIAFFENSQFYDQMDSVLRESYRAHNLVWRSMDMLSSLVGLSALLGLLLQLHLLTVVVLLLTSIPRAILGGIFANRIYGFNTERAAARRMATYLAELLSSRDVIKETRLFGLDQIFLKRFRRFWHAYFNDEKRIRYAQEWANMALALLSIIGTAGIWVYAIIQAILARITLGDVALVLQVAEEARTRLAGLFFEVGEIYENGLFTMNLFHFLDLAPGSVEGALGRSSGLSNPLLSVAQPIQQGIEFHHVSFRYPGSDRYMLGKRFDGGVDLSGGEWQKIALSRAFMRQAQILILDEPTAALDALAEYEVYRRFAELTTGKTTLFISHRFSTVRIANRILVMGEGMLKEEGTHDELMALGGQYTQMFNTQADRYKQ